MLQALSFLLQAIAISCLSSHDIDDALSDPDFRLFPSNLYHSEKEPFRSFPCLPKHIHVAQASNVIDLNVSMTVSFTLDYKDCHWSDLRPFIRYGVADADPNGNNIPMRNVIAIKPPLQFNYTSDKTSGEVFQSNWIYHMKLPDVQTGGVRYWYRIAVVQDHASSSATSSVRHRSVRGSNGYYLGETPTYYFRSPPRPGAPTVMALVGDIGQTKDSLQTLIDIYEASFIESRNHHSDAVTQLLIAGDLSYADAQPSRWTSWMSIIEPLTRSLPLHVAAGNHEVECTSDGRREIFIPYEHYFRVPNRLGPSVSEPISDLEQSKHLYGCDSPSDFLGVYDYGNSFYRYVKLRLLRTNNLSNHQ